MKRPPASKYPTLLTTSGVLVDILDKVYDAHIQDAMLTATDGQEVIDFNMGLTDPKVTKLRNEMQLSFGGSVFRVRSRQAGQDQQGNLAYVVHGEALWYDLNASDPVPAISTLEPTTALTMALQGTGWTVGVVQPAASTNALFVTDDGMSALGVIRMLPGFFGGELQFDNVNRKVHLYTRRGVQTQILYARGKNAASDQITVDSTNFYTRVYPIGANGLDIASVNGGVKYIEDYSWYDSIAEPRKVRATRITNDQLTNGRQLLSWAQGQLAAMSTPAVSYTFQTALTRADTVPNLGDTVKVWDKAMNLQGNARITNRDVYPLEPWRDAITINTSNANLANQLASQGGGAQPASNQQLADLMAPADPTNVQVSLNASFTAQGNRQLTATISWTGVDSNQDGTQLVDFDHYDVQYQLDGGAWTPLGNTTDTTVNTPALVVQNTIVARVAAIDHAGNRSGWGSTADQAVAADSAAPNTPSKPTLNMSALPLAAEVTWDGHDAAGANMPRDFSYLEVHMGTAAGFTPTASTLVDIQTSALGGTTVVPELQPNTTYFFKFVAVDRAGNRSNPASEEVSGTVGALPGNYVQSISVSQLVATDATTGTLHADVTVASRIKTADAGQRVELNSSGLQSFNPSGTKLFQLSSVDGSLNAWNTRGTPTLIVDAAGNVSVLGNIMAGAKFPSSVYAINNVQNFQFEDLDPLTGGINLWSYTSASGGTVYNDGVWASSGTGWTIGPDTTSPVQGTQSLRVTSTSNASGAGAQSNKFPVIVGEQWDIRVDVRQHGTQARGIFVDVVFYDATGATLSTFGGAAAKHRVVQDMSGTVIDNQAAGVYSTRANVANGWLPPAFDTVYRISGTITVPGGAVMARIAVTQWTVGGTANATTTYTDFDNVYAMRTLDGQSMNGGTITGSTFQTATAGARATIGDTTIPTYGNSARGMTVVGVGSQSSYGWLGGVDQASPSDTRNMESVVISGGAQSAAGVGGENQIIVYPRLNTLADETGIWAGVLFNLGGTTTVTPSYLQVAGQGGGRSTNNVFMQNFSASAGIRITGTGYVDAVTWNGAGYCNMRASAFSVSSDARGKVGIVDLPFSALEAVQHAPSKMWKRRSNDRHPDIPHFGPMAQDLPEHMMLPSDDEMHWTDLGSMIGVLWEAVRELADKAGHGRVGAKPSHKQIGDQTPPTHDLTETERRAEEIHAIMKARVSHPAGTITKERTRR